MLCFVFASHLWQFSGRKVSENSVCIAIAVPGIESDGQNIYAEHDGTIGLPQPQRC